MYLTCWKSTPDGPPRPLEAANDEVSRGFVVGWRERRCVGCFIVMVSTEVFFFIVFWKISICDLCIFLFVLPRGFKSRWF